MSKKEKDIQEALGLYNPLEFFIGGAISVEFKEDTPQILIEDYHIPAHNTKYVFPEELEYPIKNAEDFLRKVIASCKRK